MEGRNGMLDSSSDGGGKEQQGGERREGTEDGNYHRDSRYSAQEGRRIL